MSHKHGYSKIFEFTLTVILVALLCPHMGMATTQYHVAKTGNDNNPGSRGSPFLTIQKAAAMMEPGDVCIIHEGIYRESVKASANRCVFKAEEGASVTISAYEPVENWSIWQGTTYVANIDWSLGDENQLMYNEEMMVLARWPNKSNFNPFELEALWAWGTTTYLAHSEIPDLPWENGGQLFFLGENRWTSWRWPVSGSPAGRVTFAELPGDWHFAGKHSPRDGGEFFLQNILEALDAEGEWYMDGTAGKLYFKAPGEAHPAAGETLFRRRTIAFDLSGKTGVILDGLTIRGGSVILDSAVECVIKNCRIYYGNHTIASSSSFAVNQSSVVLNEGSRNNHILRNDIRWGAANGIILKGSGNRVDNNHIGNFNYLGSYACPIELRGKNSVTRNQIFNGGRDLIRGGGDGCDVGYNDLHHSNLINDDCGAIYFCCGTYGYTRIHHNWIHDITSRNELHQSYKATGIYLDNSTKQVIVDHNVMWNLEWACIQINWEGEDLLIYNNTLWSNDQPTSSSMGRWINGYEFFNVPVLNNLVNEGELHFTEESNTCQFNLNEVPFEDFANRNFVPVENSCPIDNGMVIAGYTDGFMGSAPDVGAYERGAPMWIPGPDWQAGDHLQDAFYKPRAEVRKENESVRISFSNLSPFADYLIEKSTDLSSWQTLENFIQPFSSRHETEDLSAGASTSFYRLTELYSPYRQPLPSSVITFDEFGGLAHDTHIPNGTILQDVPEGLTITIGGSDGFGIMANPILPEDVNVPALYVRGDGGGSSFLFSRAVTVPSIWVSAAPWALNNDPGGTQTISGKLEGTVVWVFSNDQPSIEYFPVTTGSGHLIDELVIYPKWTGVDNLQVE